MSHCVWFSVVHHIATVRENDQGPARARNVLSAAVPYVRVGWCVGWSVLLLRWMRRSGYQGSDSLVLAQSRPCSSMAQPCARACSSQGDALWLCPPRDSPLFGFLRTSMRWLPRSPPDPVHRLIAQPAFAHVFGGTAAASGLTAARSARDRRPAGDRSWWRSPPD